MRAERTYGDELSKEDRQRLKAALDELRAAVEDYDQYVTTEPLGMGDVTPIPLEELAKAQRRVTEAETELWRVREELLGWARPASLPSASSVTDWFSKEDEVYDKMGEVSPATP